MASISNDKVENGDEKEHNVTLSNLASKKTANSSNLVQNSIANCNESSFLINITDSGHINNIDFSAMRSIENNNTFNNRHSLNHFNEMKFNIIRPNEKSLDSVDLIQKSKTLNSSLLNVSYKPKKSLKKKQSNKISLLNKK